MPSLLSASPIGTVFLGAQFLRNHRYGQSEPNSGFRAHLIKLHGSIDWHLGPDDNVWRVRDGDIYPTRSARVLIYPQSTKYLATQRDPFASQFDLFRRALSSGGENVLTVCGYSFGDEHINQEIELALHRSDNKTTVLAFSSSVSDVLKVWQTKRWAKRLYIISESGLYVGSEGPFFPPPGSKKLDWWTFGGVTHLLSNGAEACVAYEHFRRRFGTQDWAYRGGLRHYDSRRAVGRSYRIDPGPWGRVYPIGQIGSILKVHFGRTLVFGFVTLLRIRSEELVEAAKPIPPEADQRVMEVELFAEGYGIRRNKSFALPVAFRPILCLARASTS